MGVKIEEHEGTTASGRNGGGGGGNSNSNGSADAAVLAAADGEVRCDACLTSVIFHVWVHPVSC